MCLGRDKTRRGQEPPKETERRFDSCKDITERILAHIREKVKEIGGNDKGRTASIP